METIPYTNKKNASALLVEGGGMRGAFAGGVLHAMCELYPAKNFDILLGVSAGSCSLAYYATEDRRNFYSSKSLLDIWRNELHGNQFIALKNIFKGKRILNHNYLIDELFFNKYKLNLDKLKTKIHTPFFITVTNLKNLKPEYIQVNSENIYSILKAATSLPIATRGKIKVEDKIYSDGAISDPIPLKALIEAGYKDITLILNHSRDYFSLPMNKFLATLAFPFHSTIRKFLKKEHHLKYNESKELIRNPPKNITLRIIDPLKYIPVKITTTVQKDIIELFEHGKDLALRFFH
jgi:predicted patatin/cPLA2 family phospholipase